jgi:hypothetical protein
VHTFLRHLVHTFLRHLVHTFLRHLVHTFLRHLVSALISLVKYGMGEFSKLVNRPIREFSTYLPITASLLLFSPNSDNSQTVLGKFLLEKWPFTKKIFMFLFFGLKNNHSKILVTQK